MEVSRLSSVVLLLLSWSLLAVRASSGKRLLGWLCLEICDSPELIALNLQQIESHKSSFTSISYEKYTLGPDSSLITFNFTEVTASIQSMGLETWPMLTSWPHPPEFIDYMRQVFLNPSPFIEACLTEARRYSYTGLNLDWEPTTDDVTAEDGNNYALFIDLFADSLHKEGFKLQVDVATWTPIWNYTAIALTSVDYAISMGTYTSSDTSFSSQLEMTMTAFGPERSGIGLETVNASTGGRESLSSIKWRLDEIEKSGGREVDLWKLPVPTLWWPMLTDFLRSDKERIVTEIA